MEKTAQKQILLCLYPFPPVGGPRSLRWLNLVKRLHQQGWQIDVLTSKPSIHDSFYDSSLEKDIPSGIRIYRTYPGIYYSLIHLRKRPVRGFPKTTIEWLPFGILRGLNLIKSKKYSVIISSGLPFVGHLVGYFLKRKSQTLWIADYGDPFAFNPMTSTVKLFFGRSIELHILKRVNGVILPCEEMRREFLNYYPFLEKVFTKEIKNGIPEWFEKIQPKNFNQKFAISYTGSFYKGHREPDQFFQALSLLRNKQNIMDNITVIIAGNTEKIYINYVDKLKIKSFIKFLGRISYEEAASTLKGSSVVLFLGSKWDYNHFQYKTLEYVASERPIIAIKQSASDLGADFIEKHNLGLVVSNDKEEIAKAILTLFTLWNNKSLENSFSRFPKEKLYWRVKGKELEEFLLSVIHENQR